MNINVSSQKKIRKATFSCLSIIDNFKDTQTEDNQKFAVINQSKQLYLMATLVPFKLLPLPVQAQPEAIIK